MHQSEGRATEDNEENGQGEPQPQVCPGPHLEIGSAGRAGVHVSGGVSSMKSPRGLTDAPHCGHGAPATIASLPSPNLFDQIARSRSRPELARSSSGRKMLVCRLFL